MEKINNMQYQMSDVSHQKWGNSEKISQTREAWRGM